MKHNAKLIFSYLRSHIVGQDYALKQISNAIARGESGLSMPGRPKASFLLLGPTGVGKTESAKQTALYLYGSLEDGSGDPKAESSCSTKSRKRTATLC